MLACARQKRERVRELARKREGGREGGRERACVGFSETKTNEYKQRRHTKRSPDRILIHSGTWTFFPVESISTTLMKDCKFFLLLFHAFVLYDMLSFRSRLA